MNSWMGPLSSTRVKKASLPINRRVINPPGRLPRRSRGSWPLPRIGMGLLRSSALRCVGSKRQRHKGPWPMAAKAQPSSRRALLQAVSNALQAKERGGGCSPPSCGTGLPRGWPPGPFSPESRWCGAHRFTARPLGGIAGCRATVRISLGFLRDPVRACRASAGHIDIKQRAGPAAATVVGSPRAARGSQRGAPHGRAREQHLQAG